MAQRGFAAVFRTLFQSRQQDPQPHPHVAPPDSLSSHSRYDTDGSSYSYDEQIQPRQPRSHRRVNPTPDHAVPAAPAVPAVPAPAAPPPSQPPQQQPNNNLLSTDPNPLPLAHQQQQQHPQQLPPPHDETPSSQYSLRPRRRRKPGAAPSELEPAGAETSYPAQAPASPLPPLDPSLTAPKLSVRPSRAPALADASASTDPAKLHAIFRGPLMPAPSAGTTSGIAARPNLVALGDLQGASIHTLRSLCKSIGVSPHGSREELKARIEKKIAERHVLNEDTQMLDPEGNPIIASNAPVSVAHPAKQDVQVQPQHNVDGRGRTFDGTTTTTKDLVMSDMAWDPAKDGGVTAKGKPSMDCHAKSSDPFAQGGVVAKSSSVKGGLSRTAQFGKSTVPKIEIPSKGMSTAFEKGMSSDKCHANTARLLDAPTSAVFRVPPYPPGSARGKGSQINQSKAQLGDGNPFESVDARGGGPSGFDAQDILRDVFADGQRRLSVKEFQACVKALEAKVGQSDTTRNADITNLGSLKGSAGISAKSSGCATGKQVRAELGDVGMVKGNTHGVKASFDAPDEIRASGMPRHGIPPAPPNTPGLNNMTAKSGPSTTKGSARASGILQAAATQVKQSDAAAVAADWCRNVAPGASQGQRVEMEAQRAVTVAGQAADRMDTEDDGNDIASERNMNVGGKVDISKGVGISKEGQKPPAFVSGQARRVLQPVSRLTPHIFRNRDIPGSTNKDSPLQGVFAGAVGGPDAHNTTGSTTAKQAEMEGNSAPGQRMNKGFGTPAPSKDRLNNMTSGVDKMPVGAKGAFATPRDVIKAYSQLPVGVNATGATRDDQDQEHLAHTAPQNRGSERGRDSASTPDHVPSHLRGFTTAGLLSTSQKRAPRVDEIDHSGRVIGPSSFRRRRPMSTTSGVLSDLKRSSIAYENKFISDKMRQRSSYSGPSAKPPPLSASSLKILAELRRVREESRASGLKKRPKSPIPIPPSVSKRARLEGSFNGTDSAPRGAVVSPKNTKNVADGSLKGKDSVTSKLASSAHKRKRPIAYGIGKRRSKPAALPKAAVEELRASLKQKTTDKTLEEAEKNDQTGFTFGEHWMRKSGNKDNRPLASAFKTGRKSPPTTSAVNIVTAEKPSETEGLAQGQHFENGAKNALGETDKLVSKPIISPSTRLENSPLTAEPAGHAYGSGIGKKRKSSEPLSSGDKQGTNLFDFKESNQQVRNGGLTPATGKTGLFAPLSSQEIPLFGKPPAGGSVLGQAKNLEPVTENENTLTLDAGKPKSSVQDGDSNQEPKESEQTGGLRSAEQAQLKSSDGPSMSPFGIEVNPTSNESQKRDTALNIFKVSTDKPAPSVGPVFSFGSGQAEGSSLLPQKEIAKSTAEEGKESQNVFGSLPGQSKESSEPTGLQLKDSKAKEAGQSGFSFGVAPVDSAKAVEQATGAAAEKSSTKVSFAKPPVDNSAGSVAPPAIFNFGKSSVPDVNETKKSDENKQDKSTAVGLFNAPSSEVLKAAGDNSEKGLGAQNAGGLTSKEEGGKQTESGKDKDGKQEESNADIQTGTNAESGFGGFVFGGASGAKVGSVAPVLGAVAGEKSGTDIFGGAKGQGGFVFGGTSSGALFSQAGSKDASKNSAEGGKGSDAMHMSTTPPAKKTHVLGEKEAQGFSFPTKLDGSGPPAFGQQPTGGGFGGFGGAFGTPAAAPQGGFFSGGASQTEKNASGPFGAPQFEAKPFSTSNASTFVFGALKPQAQAGGANEGGSNNNNSNMGMQFGSAFGAPQSQPSTGSMGFGSFPPAQPNATGGQPLFGSGPSSTTPAFGAPTQGATPFGGFGGPTTDQQPPTFGGLGQAPAQAQAPTQFGSSFNFGSSNPAASGEGGAFSVGSSSVPRNRGRRLVRGKRLLR